MAVGQNEECGAKADEGLYDLVRLAFHSLRRQLEREALVHGVSSAQLRFLRQLWSSNGICQRRLAGSLGLSEATATVTLRDLERKGLIDRRRNANNRREVLIFLTPKGRGLESALLPVTRDIHILATRGLAAADLSVFERMLRHVVANLDGP